MMFINDATPLNSNKFRLNGPTAVTSLVQLFS